MSKIVGWLAILSLETLARAFSLIIFLMLKTISINELGNFTLDDMRMAFYEKAANKPFQI